MSIKKIPLTAIVADPRAQPRETIDDKTIEDYAEAMRNKAKFPPVLVFTEDAKTFYLSHGFHRFGGAKFAGKDTIDADVRKGGLRGAILYACGANADQETVGLRRTNVDKRRAVLTLLRDEEWGKKSMAWIAKQARVAKSYVHGLKKENAGVLKNTSTVTGQDGKEYPARKSPKKGKKEPAKEAQTEGAGKEQKHKGQDVAVDNLLAGIKDRIASLKAEMDHVSEEFQDLFADMRLLQERGGDEPWTTACRESLVLTTIVRQLLGQCEQKD